MRTTLTLFIITIAAALTAPVSAQNNNMTFFVSSTGSGMGGNLGGVAGADKLCQGLAAKAGAGNRFHIRMRDLFRLPLAALKSRFIYAEPLQNVPFSGAKKLRCNAAC